MKEIIKKLWLVAFLTLVVAMGVWGNAGATTLTFTNAGATGKSGPTQTQINAAYGSSSGITVDSYGIQQWTVPFTGTYHIEAYGAQGGYAYLNGTGTANNGGKGAKVVGDFQLNANDTLRILVGQKGTDNPINYRGAGGGGGTFVVKAGTLLIAAGGGGGAGQYAITTQSDGQSGTSGMAGLVGTPGLGGTGGNGGGAGQSYASGGCGWLSNGTNASYSTGGLSFNNGGTGGSLYSDGTNGGFGGGGGSYAGSGGGGGYSGGGGGGWSMSGAGGGGGSYIVSSATGTSLTAGNNAAQGYVVITYTSLPSNPSIQINGGAQTTNTFPVTLTLSAANSTKMFISKLSTTPTITSGNVAGVSTGWVSYATSYSWSTAPVSNGNFTLYVWYADNAGNMSSSASDVITYDTTPPVAPTISTSPTTVTNGAVTVTINYPADATVKQYKIGAGAYQNYPSSTSQTTLNFTNAGQTGQTGPTQSQINTAYSGTNLAGKVTSSNGIQTWTVPFTGTYHIETYGSVGGSATSYTSYPGRGTAIKGDFQLTAGDTLKILVGQKGTNAYYAGGGGGGTFVTKSDNTPLIIAGGGGGAYQNNNYQTSYSDASTATSGKSYTGGSSGYGSGGGGGLTGNGGNGYGGGGYSFINGGQGGVNSNSNAGAGGFGGGGGSEWTYYGSSGAGGGYSGGNNGANGNGGTAGYSAGGGGGSYIASSAANTSLTAAANTDDGYVIIKYTPMVQVTDNNTTVYAKGQDGAGNWSTESSYTVTNIDRQAPTGSFVINKDASGASSTFANTSPLTLALTAQDDRSQTSNLKVYVSTTNSTPSASATSWANYPANGIYNYPYSGADGSITFYVWYKDEATNISTVSTGSIIYDKTPITGTVTINAGAAKTNKRAVTLTLTKNYTAAADFANVNQVIVSNKSDMSNSQSFNYADTINWTLDSDGTDTVYVKYLDWAGNTTSTPFTDSIICDTTGPVGQLTINGGANTTNQSIVMLTITATDELSTVQNKMMLSNRQDFKGAIWESLVDTKNNWPIDSAAAGVKTVYLKLIDDMGNTSVTTATIGYGVSGTVITGNPGGTVGTVSTGVPTGGTTVGTGSTGGTGYVPFSFLNSVQHYQSITLGDGTPVLVTGPNSPVQSLSDSQYNDLSSRSVFCNNDIATYSLRFDVTDANTSYIQDMAVDFDFNNYNEDGIAFVIQSVALKKYINGNYQTIKDPNDGLVAQYQGRNRYLVSFGNDNSGKPMIQVNGGGKYALDYTVKILAKKTPDVTSNAPVNIYTQALIKIFTGSGGYTEFIEPSRPSRQFDIMTQVSRI